MTRDDLDRFVIHLGALYRARRLYPTGNEQLVRAAARTVEALRRWGRPVRITGLGHEAVVEDRPLALGGSPLETLLNDLARVGRDNVCLQPDLGAQDLMAWMEALLAGRVEDGPGVVTGALRFQRGVPAAVELSGPTAQYVDMLPSVQEALSDLARERKEGLSRAREIVAAIAGHLAVGEELIRPVRELKGHDDYTFTHAMNVCVLSTVLARSLGAPPELVDQISLAGLCHDVGKQKVPVEVLNRPGALSPEERQIMDGHPAHGARLLLAAEGGVHPLLPVVAYQHHMGGDRSGYPRLPWGGAPHPASLVVAVADVFDAMRTVRPYRGARSSGEASSALVADAASGRLHRRHVSAFFGAFRILSEGRPVGLSDGRRAEVLSHGAADPLEPTVETEDGQILDLCVFGAPRIARVFDFPGAPCA